MAKVLFSLTDAQIAALFYVADGGQVNYCGSPHTIAYQTLQSKGLIYSERVEYSRVWRLSVPGYYLLEALKYCFKATYPEQLDHRRP